MSIFILTVVAALLQLPSPKLPPAVSGSSAAKNEQNTDKNQDSTKDKPPITNADRTPENKARSKEPDENAEINRRLAKYTGGLVWVGAIQIIVFAVQAGFMYKALVATRKATELTRRSLILSQRPRLKVRNLVMGEPTDGGRFISHLCNESAFRPDAPVKGTLSVVNAGNGKAIVRNSYCRVYNSGAPEFLPMRLPYDPDKGSVLIEPTTALQPGERLRYAFAGRGPSMDQYVHARDRNPPVLHLYVLGWIDYEDELGLVRTTAFCRLFDLFVDRFVPVNNPDYEHAE